MNDRTTWARWAWAAAAWSCASILGACSGPSAPPTAALVVSAHSAIHTYTAVDDSPAAARNVLAGLAELSEGDFQVQIALEMLVGAGSGGVLTLSGASTPVQVDWLDVQFVDSDAAEVDGAPGVLAVDAKLHDIDLQVHLSVAPLVDCEVLWSATGPHLHLQLDAARDKFGQVQLFASAPPVLTFAGLALSIDGCGLEPGAYSEEIKSVVGSSLLGEAMKQIEGGFGGALIGATELGLATNVTGRGHMTLSQDGSSAFDFELTAAVDDNEAPVMERVGGQLGLALDLALASTWNPCVPAYEPPFDDVLAPPSADAVDALGGEYTVVLAHRAVQHVLDHTYRSGGLCVQTAAGAAGRAGDWAELLPVLGTFSSDPTLRVRLRPGARPLLLPWSEPVKQGDPLILGVQFSDLALDMYIVLDGSPVRLYTVRADAVVSLQVLVTQTGQWSSQVQGVAVTRAEWATPLPVPVPVEELAGPAAEELIRHNLATFVDGQVWFQMPLPPGDDWVAAPPARMDAEHIGASFQRNWLP